MTIDNVGEYLSDRYNDFMTNGDDNSVDHDVAISFLASDEPLALEVADGLVGFNVFVYSKAQEEIAATDGLETFGQVFRNGSRTQVVLYRKGWGTTQWTRVEELAVRDRCLEDGFENLVFVKLDGTEAPNWVPRTHLYVDFDTYGLEQLIGVIRRKAEERGSQFRPETPAQHAQRLAARQAFERETEDLRRRPEGIQGAAQLVGGLFDELDRLVPEIADAIPLSATRAPRAYGFTTGEVTAILTQEDWPGNMLGDNASMEFTFWRGRMLLPGERAAITGNARRICSVRYSLHRTRALGYCWLDENANVLTSEQLASHIMGHFLRESDRIRQIDYDPFDFS